MAEQLRDLHIKRGQIKAYMTRAKSHIDKLAQTRSTPRLRFRRDEILVKSREFEEVQTKIELIDDTSDHSVERESFEDALFTIIGNIDELLEDWSNSAHSASTNAPSPTQSQLSAGSNGHIRLPKIELPQFGGSYEEWYSFRDTFKSLIHENSSLSAIQKFHYLRSSLKGEAADITRALTISDVNYEEAWKLLQNRYDNKRRIVHTHIRGIMDIPKIQKENSVALRQLVDAASRNTRALSALQRPVNQSDDLLVCTVVDKLDAKTNEEWESKLSPSEVPTFAQLMEFLTHRCQVLEAIAKPPMPLVTNHNRPKPRQALSSQVTTSILACPICKESHQLYKCERFRKMPVRDRVSEARKKGLCLNCLRSTNHFAIECNASRCKVCNRKHNTLLHTQSEPSQGSTAVANERGESDSEAAVANIGRGLKAASHREALLLTAKVKLLDVNGKPITVRALLDSGSQVNIITRNLAQRLRLQSKEFRAPIAGIGQMTTQPLHQIEVVLKSNYNNYRRKIDCVILNSITKKLPAVSMDGNKLAIPGNIRLADPAFYESANIDVLLGIEVYLEILCTGQIKATRSHPTLQKTQLGWVVGGCLRDVKGSPKEVACNIATQVQDVDQLVSRFWELDNVADVHPLTEQERYCEEHFKRTYRRDADGRFVVRLPIIEEKIVSLQDNRTAALNRFFSLERKLAKNPTLRDAYSSFIKEYRDLEHMRTLPEDKATPLSTYYIPHHAILNEKSATTKLRVVFDASAKSKSGISLNDALAIGPNIQDDLFSIIARFRTYAYVITADIQKMYRQIRVDESQVSLQKIFWRDDVRNPVSTCELLTLTYGTASASFLATRCLKEIADLEEGNHPIGAQVIRRDFYVDDLLTGADSIAEVREIRDQVNQVLAKAGFKLHKWAANSGKILPHIPEKVDSKQILNLNKEGDIRALGVLWDPSDDSFQYSVPIAAPVHRITKRVILASVAKVFDPLGLIGPVTVTGKVIIQRLWQRGIHWDESIPMDLETAWLHYAKQLPVLNDIRVERKTICKNAKEIEMHGFADASETAYGACIYIVSKDGRGNGSSNLLCARSRVAPLKAVSLPRLELCATVLLARMINKLTTNMRVEFRKICCWSDSTIALAWIRSPSRNWTTFVANRVAEIQERIPNAKWGHVSSAENPADFISRGVTPTELLSLDLWWHGPGMVFGNATDTAPEVPLEELPERRNTSVTCTVAMIGRDQRSREFCDRIFNKYSQFTRLVRVIAYCGRFCRNARRAQTKDIGPLTVAEIAQARERLIKLCQAQEFGEEIRAITKNPRIIVHGRLTCLRPFLDTNGIMRVGGRLQNADIAYGNKYPIVLPRSHKLTALIIQHEHIKNFHAGPQLTLAAVRENYWPMAGRSTVRGIIRRCVVCFKNAPMNSRYVMGNLPESRVTPSRPFTNTGVDYCGSFLVKEGRRRNAKYVKAYGAIFVCMATKAVHIELVTDMSTDCFIACLKRFMARRGKPANIYSDNGTNFVGANRALGELRTQVFNDIAKAKISDQLSIEGVAWHYIPPGAPNFGGLWEAAVKAAKYHLRRVVGNASLTFEELSTVLTQIEAILNSRPLLPISADPRDLNALTPAHFLIGDSLLSVSEPDIREIAINRLSRLQLIEQLRQHFWKRWSKEYLNLLNQRPARSIRTRDPLQEGHLVVIRDDNLPPLRWLLGRVEQLIAGADGIVRTAMIRTSKGTIKRAATRLCVLPIEQP